MNSAARPGLFGKLIGIAGMAVMLLLGLMFSMVLLAVVLVFGAGAFGYFWWKTRDVRKQMKEQAAMQATSRDGVVIEGESVIVEDGGRTGEVLLKVETREGQL